MKRAIVAKRAIQVVACGFGLLGLVCAYDGLCSAAGGFRDPSQCETFFTAAVSLIIGGVLIGVAWKALWRFGPNVIQSVVSLVLLVAWSLLAWVPEPSRDNEPRWPGQLLEMALVLGPLYLAFLLYRILSRKLIQITGTAASSDGPSPSAYPQERGFASRGK
jgi:hypothetical protein